MENYEKIQAETVMAYFETSKEGLTSNQVATNREKYGENKLPEGKPLSPILVFLSQFKDFLVIILIVAAIISLMMGKFESTLVILAVLILNAALGTIQHIKAEQSLKSLKSLSAPTAKVMRNGQKVEIPSDQVVVGDILVLDAGDYVSADGRIIESFSLQTNESALTGESTSIEKNSQVLETEATALGDQFNRVFFQ